ncbi:MAG: tRNA (adenosine(37)-N6)-threonylcarbamoyltransferase complex ATPase subunit type 1 TsaE [bacterium]
MTKEIRKIITSKSIKETASLAQYVVDFIVQQRSSHASVVGLIGDLGSGKTVFVQAFLREIGVRKNITSPTFVIMKRFSIPKNQYLYTDAYHIDAYRITSDDMKHLGFEQVCNNKHVIMCIEWADRIKTILPIDTVWIHCEYGKNENERKFTIN